MSHQWGQGQLTDASHVSEQMNGQSAEENVFNLNWSIFLETEEVSDASTILSTYTTT